MDRLLYALLGFVGLIAGGIVLSYAVYLILWPIFVLRHLVEMNKNLRQLGGRLENLVEHAEAQERLTIPKKSNRDMFSPGGLDQTTMARTTSPPRRKF